MEEKGLNSYIPTPSTRSSEGSVTVSTEALVIPPTKKYKRKSSCSSTGSTEEEILNSYFPKEKRRYSDASITISTEALTESPDDSFLHFFFASKGPPHLVVICILFAASIGSTVGIVPAVMTDRFARLNHGFDEMDVCASFDAASKPEQCLQGSQDAQNMSAVGSLITNILTFVMSPLVGSMSDMRGRKAILVAGMILSSLSSLSLVLIQLNSRMSPLWYYGTYSLSGFVNFMAIILSSISDIMPEQWRAASFGVIFAGFYLGFAFSPALALTMSHQNTSIGAMGLWMLNISFSLFCLPETLSPENAATAKRRRDDEEAESGSEGGVGERWKRVIFRPLKEMSILNRDSLFRTLAALAFLGGMVSAADQSLLLYYLEERYDFKDVDISAMFLLMGVMGVFVQSVLLKPMTDFFGEKRVLIIAYAAGTCVNFSYGVAPSKKFIFIAIAAGTLSGVGFPTISAVKSNNTSESEQGRIQGALGSVSSLALALGPLLLRFVYRETEDWTFLGPGAMYIFAACLYAVATMCACTLPKERTDSKNHGIIVEIKGQEMVPSEDEEGMYGATELELVEESFKEVN